MTALDFVFLIPMAILMIKGFQRGILIELISVIALIIAIIGCLKLTYILINMLHGREIKSEWLPLVAYLTVFCIIYLLIYLLGKFLEKILKATHLNFINRIAGMLLGIFKAVFIFSLLIWMLDRVNIFPESIKEKSISYKYIKPVAPVIIDMVSSLVPVFKDIINQIETFFDNITSSHHTQLFKTVDFR